MNSMRSYVERRMPLVWKLIIPLNRRGVLLDQMKLGEFRNDRLQKRKTWRRRAEKHFKELGIGEYNEKLKTYLPIGPKGSFSNVKLRRLLYEELKLPEYTDADGIITVDKKALKWLARRDSTGTIDLLIENSKSEEARNALLVKPDSDGRVRTRFVWGGDEKWDLDETGKESPGSGRLASRDPNLQNIPDWVREIYITSKRYLLKCDYSQIELRLAAHLSGDPELQRAVETDAHLYIMSLVDEATDLYGLHTRGFDQLLRDYRAQDPDVVFARDETKRTAYGWLYRMGAKKLEIVRGVPFQRGKQALAALNHKFHYVTAWWDSLVAEVEREALGSGYGYLSNEYGRIRRFFTDDVPKICNCKPQGLAADILFDAMETLEESLGRYEAEMVLTAHDEVVVDTPTLDVVPYIREVMERPIPELDGLVIPVDILAGKNWAKYHKHQRCKTTCGKPENLNGQRELEHAA